MRISLDVTAVQTLSLFDQFSKVQAKDCIIEEERIVFIVKPEDLPKAIGKGGGTLHFLEQKLKKRVKIVAFDEQLVNFIKNLLYPINVVLIEEKEGIVFITPQDSKSRGIIIGKMAKNLRAMEKIVQRYFQIKEIKVTQNGQ